jgi:hypothetical protein
MRSCVGTSVGVAMLPLEGRDDTPGGVTVKTNKLLDESPGGGKTSSYGLNSSVLVASLDRQVQEVQLFCAWLPLP